MRPSYDHKRAVADIGPFAAKSLPGGDAAQIYKPVNVEAIEAKTGASAPLKGDTAEALAFLRNWPTDFPHVVAIAPDDRKIEARAFTHEDLRPGGPAERWIDKRQGRMNLHFSVNTLGIPIDKKASKADVSEIVALQSDLDPPDGTNPEVFAEETVGALLELERVPSTIIKSGGGVQALWVLKAGDRILVHGDLNKAEDAECYTRGIEEMLASRGLSPDTSCHNVDRVMRLPGTINLPNKKKRDKGRKPALATVAYYSGAVYSLSEFPKAAPKQSTPPHKSKSTSGTANYRYVDPNDPELAGLDDKWKNPELADEHYDGDRSRAALAFAIACKAANVSDETLKNILMTWDIGQHIRDQANAPRALDRVLQKARERVTDPGHELRTVDIGDPTDLWADEGEPPDLAEGILPEALECWARDEAKRIGTCLGATSLAGIVVCSAALSSRFRVQVKQNDTDHREAPILWGTLVGDVSARKTPVFKSMMKALDAIECENDLKNREAWKEFKKKCAEAKKAKEPEPEKPAERRWWFRT